MVSTPGSVPLFRQVLTETMDELTTWRFEVGEGESRDDPGAGSGSNWKLDLGMNCIDTRFGNRVLSLYAPFWMINKTGKDLTYRLGHIISASSLLRATSLPLGADTNPYFCQNLNQWG